jgi:hypothetical protein
MTAPEFVHLHVHSEYSLLDGANRIGDLIAACKKDGQGALALTDHGNLFGAIELYQTARKEGVQADRRLRGLRRAPLALRAAQQGEGQRLQSTSRCSRATWRGTGT